MAVVVLSPYPPTTSAAGRTAARDFLRSNVSGLDDAADDAIDLLGEAASATVERYAPDSPAPIKSAAALRVAAYLHGFMPKSVQNLRISGGTSIRFERSRFFAANPLQNSGALALLSPWRTHRALPIEGPDA